MSADSLREEKIASPKMFSRIHRRYDLMNHVLTFGLDLNWRRQVARTVSHDLESLVSPDILDLAAGTGDMAIALGKRMKAATITLGDPSAEMLDIARRKMLRRVCCARFSVQNAERLDFPANSFDALTIAFGVRNFPDPISSLIECQRVLRPGGNLYVLEFGRPGNKLVYALYRAYSMTIIPLLGWIIGGNTSAYRYLTRSIRYFPSGKEFTDIMLQAGFQSCDSKAMSAGIVRLYRGKIPGQSPG